MSTLVSNGGELYRKSGKLVRTPITVKLTPDERALYPVAGTYAAQGSVMWPDSGFILQNTVSNVWAVGASCIQAYLNPTDRWQSWFDVTSAHDPETVWYQGAFATSAPNGTAAYQSCEAYIQIGAYHFTIPANLSGLGVTSAKVTFTNGGGVAAYQSPSVQSNNNSQLKGKYDFGSWYMPFAVSQSLVAPNQLGALPYDAAVDILADAGTWKGIHDLWGFAGTTRNGAITTLSTPVQKSYTMGSATLAAINANGGGWIIPYIDAEYYGAQNYAPYYVNPTNGYWGCLSVWGVSLEITVD